MAAKPITGIKGIGPRRAEALGSLGLFSLLDLVRYAPRDYLDFTKASRVSQLSHGDTAAVRVRVTGPARQVRVRRGFVMTVARATDGERNLELCWYNQPYRAKSVEVGMEAYACGRIDGRRGLKLVDPAFYEELPGIVPVYPVARGVSQKLIRDAVRAALTECLNEIEETLPEEILSRYALMPLRKSLFALHAPEDFASLEEAKRRLAFEDMLLYSLMIAILKSERKKARGTAFCVDGLREEYIAKLPYRLTRAQLRAIDEIGRDMASGSQMNRLLQGDVGSGKTAVAMFAMYAALKNGKTAALMAPTEILAAQHYETLKTVFGEDAVLLTGGMKAKEKREAVARMQEKPRAVVGTHALLSEGLALSNLGLVIADEQHRFGVRQRAVLGAKGSAPDTLIMSATPIPRTLSLILFGDLDISVLDELPPGRKPVVTRVVPRAKRDDMYAFIEAQIKKGAQAFAVCPLVEESDALGDVLGARELCEELTGRLDVRVGLVHGRLAEKEAVAEAFRRGEIDLLVSTTVVEVGVDVPRASVMAIENAERFGLAQLHQLRGRVGRGTEISYCFLLSGAESEAARERLSVLAATNDGFEIARRDLELRGPGEFLGTRQHGMDGFAAARFASDMRSLNEAREAADWLVETGGAGARALMDKARETLASMEKTVAKN
jgi:ATP-dependent DNA helicase RecG